MDALQQAILIYSVLIVGTIVFANMYTKQFLFRYAWVRSSNGKKILVKAYTKTGYYYAVGTVVNGVLKYTNREKVSLTFSNLPAEAVYPILGVREVAIDEARGLVFQPSVSHYVSGHDPERVDDMLATAYMKPSRNDKKIIIIIVLLVFVMVIAGAAAYFGYKNYAVLVQVLQKVSAQTVNAAVVAGG